MNKRKTKKLKRRRGLFHYRAYKQWLMVSRFGCRKYGQKFLDYINDTPESLTGYTRTIMMLTLSKSGRSIVDLDLYSNVYPSSCSMSGLSHIETGVSHIDHDTDDPVGGVVFKTLLSWRDTVYEK